MCPRPERMEREVGFMDMELFQKIIDEVSGFSEPVRAKEIELFHFGESLLHPRIHEMAGYASGSGLNITLSVNAPELTPQILDALVSSGPCRIIISFDGYDEKSYREIRGKAANFEKAARNLEYAASLVRSGLKGTKISVRIIRLNKNNSRIEDFRRNWESLGLPVEVREFFPWTEKELSPLGVVQKYPPFMPCPFPWQYLVVQWDGTVVPCCRDYNGVNPMGNVRVSSLKEIWNSTRYADFRAQHLAGQYAGNELCGNCMEIFYTEE
jgi:radical SAM protein with 4Fe4S-binding SPASM domain